MVLSNFFGKSKPIVFLILVAYVSIHFWTNAFRSLASIQFAEVGKYILLLFLLFGINFIVKRNKISQQNALAAFFFTMLCTAFPSFYLDFNYLIPAVFVVLGLRRIISLKTQIEPKKKIFDASLWFFVASLFQPFVLFIMPLVFLAVIQYTLYDPKNLFVPIIAWACGSLFITTYHVWQTDEWILFYEYYKGFSWNNFEVIWQQHKVTFSILLPIVIFVFLGISKVINKAQLALKTSLTLIFLSFLFILSGWMFSETSQAGGLGIACIPFSMLAGTSLEIRTKPIIKEIVLILVFLASVFAFWV